MSGAKIVHFAPEFSLARRLRRLKGVCYTTGDALISFIPGICIKPDVVTNLTNLVFADESFDAVICNHVLEHIVDDDIAISEMYRVLRHGGVAFVTVPIRGDSPQTLQEEWVNTDELKDKYYGTRDHVRLYGIDITKKFEDAGFSVNIIRPGDMFAAAEIVRQGLDPCEPHFILRKDGPMRN